MKRDIVWPLILGLVTLAATGCNFGLYSDELTPAEQSRLAAATDDPANPEAPSPAQCERSEGVRRTYVGWSLFSFHGDGPETVVRSMGDVQGGAAGIGAFQDRIKRVATVPRLMALVGLAGIVGAVLLVWLGKNLRGGLIVAAVGAALIVAAAAFEAQPLLASVLLVVAILAALAYLAFGTAAGRRVQQLGIRSRQFREVITGGQQFKAAVEAESWAADDGRNQVMARRILELFRSTHMAAQDADTQAAVKVAKTNG